MLFTNSPEQFVVKVTILAFRKRHQSPRHLQGIYFASNSAQLLRLQVLKDLTLKSPLLRHYNHFEEIISRNYELLSAILVLCSLLPFLMLTFWVAVLPLFTFAGSGSCHQVPSSVNVTHTNSALSLPPPNATRSIPSLYDQYTDHRATVKQELHARDEQATAWTSVQYFPLEQASVPTFETTTTPNGRSSNTITPFDSSHNDHGEGGITGSTSLPAGVPPAGHTLDLKRSAGIFVTIKAILVSWVILLVGMLTYMVARHAEEALSEEPILDTEPVGDRERAALLGQDSV